MKLAVMTGNPGKMIEIKGLLEPLGIVTVQRDMDYPEIQSSELREVVKAGADWLMERQKCPFILDDSGLFINAHGGFPGVYSSYVHKSIGNKGILRLMERVRDRTAVFRTVIGLMKDKDRLEFFIGECRGSITTEEEGDQGFGYDPIFKPEGMEVTFANMSTAQKNSCSHRGKALKRLREHLKAYSF